MAQLQTNQMVLFLCTGNYYRSRFAEELFNHVALERSLPYTATSRGLRVREVRPHNPGTMSCHTWEALAARSIPVRQGERDSQQVLATDMEQALLTVALSEQEHRPMMERLFPEHAERIRYWQIEDIGLAEPADALAATERLTLNLIEEVALGL